MRKILSLFAVLTVAISLQAATITKVGDTFGTVGFASVGQQTVSFSYQVTKLPSGSAPGEVKLTAVDAKGFAYQNLYVPAAFQHTYSGSNKVFRLTEVGRDVFYYSNYVNVLFGYSYGELPPYIQFDEYSFAVSTELLSVRWYTGTTNPSASEISSQSYVKFGDVLDDAFVNCHKLNMIVECGEIVKNGGANVTHKIGEYAFGNCYEIPAIICGGSNIDPKAFSECKGVRLLSWLGGSASITSEEQSPFYSMRYGILGISIYGSVPDYYFRNFQNLASVGMPEDIWSYASVYNTTIGKYAFSGCSKLSYVSIGGKVDGNAFYDSPNINTVYWRGGETDIKSDNMSIFRSSANKITTFKFESTSGSCSVPAYICAGLKAIKSVTIPANTGGKIGQSAFKECTALETVNFDGDFSTYAPEIGPYAFNKCTALKTITTNNKTGFPDKLYKIGENAFAGCYALTTGLQKNNTNIAEIGTNAFYSTGITTLVIPNTTQNLKLGKEIAGGYQSKLTAIHYLYSKSLSRANAGGSYANVFLSAGSSGTSYRKNVTKIELGTTVTEIPDSLFYSFKGVEDVTWGAAVEKIGNHAFHDCTKLKYILMNNVKTIGESAFENADMSGSAPVNAAKLTSIGKSAYKNTLITEAGTNCNALTKIEDNAFENCKKLVTVTIPENVTTLYSDIFKGCSALTTVNWEAKSYAYAGPFDETIGKQITKFGLGDNVELVPRQLLNGANLKLLEFPTSVKNIGANAFKNCTIDSVAFVCYNAAAQSSTVSKPENGPFAGSVIKALYMPGSVKTAPKYMFANAAAIDKFVYKGLETFDQYSFAGAGLKEVTFNNIKSINANAFANCASLGTIYLIGSVCTPGNSAFSGCSVKKIVATCANYNDIYNNATWKAVCATIENSESKFTQSYLDELLGRDVMGTDFWSTNSRIEITSPLSCDGTVTLKAIPADGAAFQYWKIDGSTENPRTFDLNEWDFWFIGAFSAFPSDFHQQHFAMVPEEAGYIEATNEYGHDRNDQRFINEEQAVLRAHITNDWYEFQEWQWADGVADQPMMDPEDPAKCSFYIRYMPGGDMGGGGMGMPGYYKVTADPVDWSGTYYIGYEDPDDLSMMKVLDGSLSTSMDAANNYMTVSLMGDMTPEMNPSAEFTIEPNGTGWAIHNSMGEYINVNSDANKLNVSTTMGDPLTLAMGADGGIDIIAASGAHLRFNKAQDQLRFRFFKSTSYNNQQPVQLYRYSSGGGGMEPTEQPQHDENLKAVCRLRAIDVAVEVSHNGGGVINIEGGSLHKLGEEITLTATADEGFVFKGWSNNTTNATVKLTLDIKNLIQRTMMGMDPETGEMTFNEENVWDGYTFRPFDPSAEYIYKISAVFDADPNYKKTYTITAVSLDPEKGNVSGGGEYKEGEMATLTATPAEGFQFSVWSDGVAANPRVVTVTGDATFTAIFTEKVIEKPTYTITVTAEPAEGGSVSGGGVYDEGSTITLVAVPAAGYEFVKWSDENTDNPRTVVVTADASYTALFKVAGEGIGEVPSDQVQSIKVLRDGVLYIERNGRTYDAQGKRVK